MNLRFRICSIGFLLYYALTCLNRVNACPFIGCDCNLIKAKYYEISCIGGENSITFPARNSSYDPKKEPYISILTIKNFKFSTIPNGRFNGLPVLELIFVANGLEKLTNESFAGIKDLSTLRFIEETKLEEVEQGTFININISKSLYPTLEVARMPNTIDRLMANMSELNSLKFLQLAENSISELGPWMQNFVELEAIDLVGNNLTSLNETAFKNNKQTN
jgi:hypothetical protein